MVKHEPFFAALGSIDESSSEWKVIFSGLSVLRVLDRVTSGDVPEGILSDLESSRMAADQLSAGDPVRAILLRILDGLGKPPKLSESTGADLLSYGRALDLRGQWPLAADVFDTTSTILSASQSPRVVIEASNLLGAAARSSGDWEMSHRAYSRAEHLANRIGDKSLALTARIGMANSSMIRGNLQEAEAELDEIISAASADRLEGIQAIALHARCSVEHQKGEYEKAINYAYRSLELTTNPGARERLLSDIAAAYAALGMWNTARDAYSIVALTSPHQWVRWQVTLNLAELAIQEGDEEGYDRYMKQIEGAALDPKLRAYEMYFRAKGFMRFGRPGAEELFDKAQAFAESNQLHQLAFEIEKMKSAPQGVTEKVEQSEELRQIAEVIGHLRDQAEGESG